MQASRPPNARPKISVKWTKLLFLEALTQKRGLALCCLEALIGPAYIMKPDMVQISKWKYNRACFDEELDIISLERSMFYYFDYNDFNPILFSFNKRIDKIIL